MIMTLSFSFVRLRCCGNVWDGAVEYLGVGQEAFSDMRRAATFSLPMISCLWISIVRLIDACQEAVRQLTGRETRSPRDSFTSRLRPAVRT